MHCSTFFAITAAVASLVAASPLERRAIPTFTQGEMWDMILDRSHVDLAQLKAAPGKVIDIDLLDVIDARPALPDIKELAKTKKVICYFSAGSYETWRADAGSYTRKDYGAPLDSRWNNEFWVDVRSSNVRAIVKKRIERAAAAGCSAIDPDNVDGYVSAYLHVSRGVC
jgi:endo-alpha-1,4-polygalactosaminidase (GH114 family)